MLGGKIPSEICNLESLEYMNLSQNDLSVVQFQAVLTECMACQASMYPITSCGGQFPTAKHFKMLPLKHFRGIKDCEVMLTDCHLAKLSLRTKVTKESA